jgi:hypothetical protein
MKNIVLRALLFFAPILGVIALYIYLDPFKLVGLKSNYKPMGQPVSVPLNQNRVSAGTFLFYKDSLHYNSFIFGSSRSMFYEIHDWVPYLDASASCLHFDASAETLEGILHKVQFIDREGGDFRNVLFILDVDIFRSYTLLNEHLYMEDPLVVGYSKWLPFQSGHFMAFLDRKFLRAYLEYRFTGKYAPYMSSQNVLDDKPFAYDPLTNEVRYTYYEELAAQGLYYTEERLKKFEPKRDGMQRYAQPVIEGRNRKLLEEIATLLGRHSCAVKVVISPLFNQVNMAKEDVAILQSVFGRDVVYDFSGINNLTNSHTGYYERSHYRPHIAKAVLDSIYNGQPL